MSFLNLFLKADTDFLISLAHKARDDKKDFLRPANDLLEDLRGRNLRGLETFLEAMSFFHDEGQEIALLVIACILAIEKEHPDNAMLTQILEAVEEPYFACEATMVPRSDLHYSYTTEILLAELRFSGNPGIDLFGYNLRIMYDSKDAGAVFEAIIACLLSAEREFKGLPRIRAHRNTG